MGDCLYNMSLTGTHKQLSFQTMTYRYEFKQLPEIIYYTKVQVKNLIKVHTILICILRAQADPREVKWIASHPPPFNSLYDRWAIASHILRAQADPREVKWVASHPPPFNSLYDRWAIASHPPLRSIVYIVLANSHPSCKISGSVPGESHKKKQNDLLGS